MSTCNWSILCWNIRGINASEKWDAVRDKIKESASLVICLQETKREIFDMAYIRKFAPRHFDTFDFIPLIGASGGILVLWNNAIFSGSVLDKQSFGMTAFHFDA
jgi:exonuclease III